jgi:hypothetical protein
MKTPSLEHTVACLSSAIPYAILAWTLLQVWVAPLSVADGAWVRTGMALMLMEFLAVHSGMFMGGMAGSAESIWKRYLLFTGLLLFYLIFAIIFAALADSVEAFGAFILLMIGRFVTVVLSSREAREQFAERIVNSLVVYLIAVFGTFFLPMPELGVTPDIVEQVFPDHGGGEWERHPHIPIAAGVFYFGVLAYLELRLIWKRPAGQAESDNSQTDTDNRWNVTVESEWKQFHSTADERELPVVQSTQEKQGGDGPK